MALKPDPGKTLLPVRNRARVFVLMPFADAMFQLLVFFMVASNVTPYSIIPISGGQAAIAAGAQMPDTSDPLTADLRLLSEWTVQDGHVELPAPFTEPVPFSELESLVSRMEVAGIRRVFLTVGGRAEVQDVVVVVEAVMDSDVDLLQFRQADLR